MGDQLFVFKILTEILDSGKLMYILRTDTVFPSKLAQLVFLSSTGTFPCVVNLAPGEVVALHAGSGVQNKHPKH